MTPFRPVPHPATHRNQTISGSSITVLLFFYENVTVPHPVTYRNQTISGSRLTLQLFIYENDTVLPRSAPSNMEKSDNFHWSELLPVCCRHDGIRLKWSGIASECLNPSRNHVESAGNHLRGSLPVCCRHDGKWPKRSGIAAGSESIEKPHGIPWKPLFPFWQYFVFIFKWKQNQNSHSAIFRGTFFDFDSVLS